MKKILSLLLIIIITFTSCSNNDTSNQTIVIEGADETYNVGDAVELFVKTNGKRKKSNDNYFWSSDDTSVASVSSNGMLSIKNQGLCHITAKDKEDQSLSHTISVFCPYTTVEIGNEKKSRFEENGNTTGLTDTLANYGFKYGKKIIQSMTGKIGTLGVITTAFSFFQKDVLLFSTGEAIYYMRNSIVYTVTDWTNSPVTFSLGDINSYDLYESMSNNIVKSATRGSTYDDMITTIRSELTGQIANDGIYHLDKMDDKYEYRIVICADYCTYLVRDFYYNGLLSGLGLTIKEALELDLSDFSNNYTYTKTINEVFDVENVRICIECRPKQ